MLTPEQEQEFKQLDEFVSKLKSDKAKLERLVDEYLLARKGELESTDENSKQHFQTECDLFEGSILEICEEWGYKIYEEMGNGIIYYSVSKSKKEKIYQTQINFKS